jgi:protein-L-isoaspartate(D-aspartate) O-methyltransferase
VLEIGTGSGYQAAILGKLAREVYSVERHPSLAESAEQLFQELGYKNIQVHVGDGTRGLPDFAPYDAIMVTAAAPEVPGPLLDQLVDGGRLIMPVGGRIGQVLHLYQRQGEEFTRDDLTPVAFVPLIGAHGWPMV